jgi:alcohol dehydrogenase class IV
VLLTTERAALAAPELSGAAATTLHVPAGRVDEISAPLVERAGGRPPVALGGGRVIDTAKALAGAGEGRCAAVPTTLSGAEMTPFHRTPAGIENARLVRPALVIADPALMASAPGPRLAATAMNALAHAMEALYTPLANPVAEMAALRAAELIAAGVPRDPPDAEALALGALLAGYASGSTGIAIHHAICQTIVRTAGTPHAETNAVMLPHSARLMSSRAPGELGLFARAVGDPDGDPGAAAGRVAKLAARSGHTRLSTLGVEADDLPTVTGAVGGHPLVANTLSPPDEQELAILLQEAL